MSFGITISYLRSLLLAVLLSFIAPIALIGSAIVILLLIGSVPGFMFVGQACAAQLLYFLATFGNGSAWEGVIVIGCACAVVGGLFDTYIFTVTTSTDKFDTK
jgi:hypothetical protein